MVRLLLIVTLLFVTPVQAQTTRPSDEVDARRVLNQRISNVRLDAAPLADVFELIRDSTQVNLVVDWSALEAAGVSQDMPITLQLRSIQPRKLLDLVLRQAGGDLLSWYVSENVVHVTTREIADRAMITIVYPVQDLLVEVPNFQAPDFSLDVGGGEGGGNLGLGQGSGEDDRDADLEARAQRLIDLITTIVEPDVWEDAGGPARIRHLNGTLVITAPRSVHDKIDRPRR